VKHRSRRIAVIVLCLCFALPSVAAPVSPWISPFARFLAYLQSKLAPPLPGTQGRLSPPVGTHSKLSPPWPVAPPSDTTGITVAPTLDTTDTTVAPPPP
jgi:hypothetical protein